MGDKYAGMAKELNDIMYKYFAANGLTQPCDILHVLSMATGFAIARASPDEIYFTEQLVAFKMALDEIARIAERNWNTE